MKIVNFKFLVWVVVFILIPLIILGAISFTIFSRALEENSRKHYEQMVQTFQHIVDKNLEERIKQIRLIGKGSALSVFANFLEVGGADANRIGVDREVGQITDNLLEQSKALRETVSALRIE
jgi:hypothetical protein